MQYLDGISSRLAAALAEASPSATVVLVYEEIIRSLEVAIWAIEQKDIVRRFRYADRAIALLVHLYGNLDMERGGEVAANLARSYRIILARVVLINIRNDAALAQEAVQLIRPLLDAWRQIGQDTIAALGGDLATLPAIVPADNRAATAAPGV